MRGVLLALSVASGCVTPGVIEDPGEPNGETPRGGTYVSVELDTRSTFAPGGPALPIFLNRYGGTYSGGPDDASANVSSVVAFAGVGQVVLGGYGGGDAAWTEIVGCVREQFAPFNVEVTDLEPASGEYVEAVFGGSGVELGMSGYGGVAPIDTGSCSIIPRAVVFIFTHNLGGSSRVICEVAAQELGHAFSLDHAYLCSDPMTYLDGCGEKKFQDVDAECGEYAARECICGRPSQNSVRVLTEKLGAASGVPPMDPPPPTQDSCGGVDYYGQCSADGVLTWCQGGALQSIDCAASGYECAWEDDTIGYNCLPPVLPCGDVTYQGECSVDGLLSYCQDGVLQTIDCVAEGLHCAWQDDTIGYNCI
jgi:hypothetical protein